MEQQRAAGLAERQVAQLVEDDQIHSQQAVCDAPGAPLGLLALQRIDQVDRRVEAHSATVPGDAGHAQRRGQVRLARAGPADEDDVLRLVDELHLGQPHDQLVIDGRDVELEAREIAVHRELRRVHLVFDRAHAPIDGLGLQQVFDQPAPGIQAALATLFAQLRPGTGHTVQPQVLQLQHHITHGRSPRRGLAGCHSGPCRPAVA
jgi:hypothetical protein